MPRRRYSAGEGIHDATAGSVYDVSNRPHSSLCGAEDENVLLALGDQMHHGMLAIAFALQSPGHAEQETAEREWALESRS